MKITFEYAEPVGTMTRRKIIVLGDDGADAPVGGFDDAASIEVQTVPYPRAGTVSFHRANQKWDLAWTTVRAHANETEAINYRITHKQECLKMKGTLKIVNGSKTFTAPAIVRAVDAKGSGGVKTITNYQVVCDTVS